MKRPAMTVVWTVAASALLVVTAGGCSSGDKNASATADRSTSAAASSPASPAASIPAEAAATTQATVTTKSVGHFGTILVDGKGRTLYLFKADTTKNQSTCTSACAVAWPPLLTTGTAKATGSTKSGLLGIAKRSGGASEVGYNGHPLYYFAGDTAPGQTNGQGLNQFGALWYVVNPGGDAVTTS